MNMVFICAAILFIAAVYFFMSFPSRKKRLSEEFLRLPIAHRGAHAEGVCENSMPAFAKAIELGLPFEIDLRRTLDGVPVVFHDESLLRLCGINKKINEVTFEELKSFTLSGTSEQIPTLEEVLRFTAGRTSLLLELKGGTDPVLVTECARLLAKYQGVFAVQSFNPYYLYRFRRLLPQAPIGFLIEKRRVRGVPAKAFVFLSRALMFNCMFRPDFISCRYSKSLSLPVRLARVVGAYVLMWTVKNQKEAKHALEICDGVICDNAAEILEGIKNEMT